MTSRTVVAGMVGALLMLASGCGYRPARVVGHYYDETANDGVVERDIWTTCEMVRSKERFVRQGDIGTNGAVFAVRVDWFGMAM